MLRKTFILTQFGPPHAWTAQYLEHIQTLAPLGYSWKILTPNKLTGGSNVEIVPMSVFDFDRRVHERTGVVTGNLMEDTGLPGKLISDYYPAFGDLFPDLLTDADYWSITNWDVVYGRLDHFLPDSELARYDIWSDDRQHINSLFCFYRNTPWVNTLYKLVSGWERMFQYNDVPIYGFDEVHFDRVIRALAAKQEVRLGGPPYFAYHSYDRLTQHVPKPNLTMAPDGALLECFDDGFAPLAAYAPWRGYFGREIMYFHFIKSKQWPMFRPFL
jgi:hypothetical protein